MAAAAAHNMQEEEAMMLLRTPSPPSSVKIPNTQPIKQKQHGSTQPSPSIVDFEWPPFDEKLFNKICNKFVDDINNIIKKHIPSEDYRDNDVTCCSPALKNIAKDLIMLFMKHKITTSHATSYETGYKILILSIIGYYFIQNEWDNALERMRISLPPNKIFDDSMMVIMELVKSGFGHGRHDLDPELREITRRLFVVDNIRSIRKPNDGGGKKRSTRRKLKPYKRRTKMKK